MLWCLLKLTWSVKPCVFIFISILLYLSLVIWWPASTENSFIFPQFQSSCWTHSTCSLIITNPFPRLFWVFIVLIKKHKLFLELSCVVATYGLIGLSYSSQPLGQYFHASSCFFIGCQLWDYFDITRDRVLPRSTDRVYDSATWWY